MGQPSYLRKNEKSPGRSAQAVAVGPDRPDPAPLGRAMGKLKAELGSLEGYEPDLARAVLEAAGRGWPWPFDGLEEAERAALLVWAVSPDKEACP